MGVIVRRGIVALIFALLVVSIAGCGGQEADPGSSASAETEVTGMPAEFPADVPVHPGTVTSYEPTQVTDWALIHQLYVESQASFDEVVSWYQDSMPAGWSVGFFEDIDNEGDEAKIALDGPGYMPADPDGVGGGVLIGVFVNDDATLIVTTVNEETGP